MFLNINCLLLTIFASMSISYIVVPGPPRASSGISDFEKISNPRIGPKGMPYNKTTSCQTFAKYARFNPHSVVGVKWFVFFYWAKAQPTTIYDFWIPSKMDLKFLHYALDGHLPARFNWSSTLVLMRNLVTNVTNLLEERGDRGQYFLYHIYLGIPKGKITRFMDIRLKQTGDNKYLGLMYCKNQIAFIMSRLDDVPPKNKLHEEAAKLGYRGRKGKSYLYQGHEWMPIGEMDEDEYWMRDKKTKMVPMN